jgi:hypothetical protein
MIQDSMNVSDPAVGKVSKWVSDVSVFLELFERWLDGYVDVTNLPESLRPLAERLPASLQLCRAQKPTRSMIESWVRWNMEQRTICAPVSTTDNS